MHDRRRYIMSFFREEIVEQGNSTISPGLQVWYAYGRYMLNTANVNYSFGRLDKVFRSAFRQLKIKHSGMKRVLLLGLGAGNVTTILRELDPKISVLAVEIDPEVVRLGKAYFGLEEGPQLKIEIGDAISYVQQCQERFDMVVVDLFVDAEVPPAACSPDFLLRMADLLEPRGLLVFNRLAHEPELLQHTEAFGRKMAEVLPGTWMMDADLNKVLVYEKK